MNKDVKELWLTALRSGKYTQGTHCLRRNDRFCVLGVLCDLASQEGVCFETWGISNLLFDDTTTYYDDHSMDLPESVMEWADIDSHLAEFNFVSAGYQTNLSFLNDNEERSFAELADVIEREF